MLKIYSNVSISGQNIVLSAFGIHAGGGLVLLNALIKGLGHRLKAAALDSRYVWSVSPAVSSKNIFHVRRSFIARLLALKKLVKLTTSDDTFLCFNSLPPLRKSKGKVVIFVHAPHFFNAHCGIRYSRITALRIDIERLWFKAGIHNCDEIWVQTSLMQQIMQLQYPLAVVKVIPLVDDNLAVSLSSASILQPSSVVDDTKFSFFYPADGVGHKNHENLLKAWILLAGEGRNPKLFLTLNKDELNAITKSVQCAGVTPKSVINLGWLGRDEVLEKLSKSSALIFPSKAETFGLPMLEARSRAVPIIASERDFVRDVCVPHETFDPDSPRSIAMAVLRFMDAGSSCSATYYSAEQFVSKLTL